MDLQLSGKFDHKKKNKKELSGKPFYLYGAIQGYSIHGREDYPSQV